LVTLNVQPPKLYVYVTFDEPTPAVAGQNWLPVTPFPDQIPPAGEPTKVTQGALTQNGPDWNVGIIFSTNTFKRTGGPIHPNSLVGKTETAFVIRPAFAVTH
jgi:hypothetical protein